MIVTGLPRSGTSLMMNILRNNGYLVDDRIIRPKEFNPDGYFETEETSSGIRERINGVGKAYKVILYAFLRKSVIFDDYKVILCIRNPYAIAVSQEKSENGLGSIERNLENVSRWYSRFLEDFSGREYLVVDYDEVFLGETVERMSNFLGFDVNIQLEDKSNRELDVYKRLKGSLNGDILFRSFDR